MSAAANVLQATGRVHSIETFGTVDGPGVRLVVFLQGCPLRCAYCHNPDTWDAQAGEQMRVGQILDAFERNRAFYKDGGITCTGGEPLMQADFVAQLFRAAHDAPSGRIHTCLDTSGATWNTLGSDAVENAAIQSVLDETDLVLLDVKHTNEERHEWLCGHPFEPVRSFGDELARRHLPCVVRRVLVPGITDEPQELDALGELIAQWPNVVGLDLLPYHTMGVEKYHKLGLSYRLEGVEPYNKDLVNAARQRILRARSRHM